MPPFNNPALFPGVETSARPVTLPALAVFMLAFSTPGALAQQPSKQAQPIETLLVTGRAAAMALDTPAPAANRLGLSHRETPASLDVLTQERMQIEGLRTSVEALNAAPGVNSGTLPGSVGVSSMRGFTSNAIAYLGAIALAITGPVMWWKRRPKGQLAAPKPLAPIQMRNIAWITLGFMLLFPLAGLSLVVILIGEKIVGLVRNIAKPY